MSNSCICQCRKGRKGIEKTGHIFLPSPRVRDIGSVIFWERFENANNFWNAASKEGLKFDNNDGLLKLKPDFSNVEIF